MYMMQKENVMTLYNDIEFPLVTVLAKMEMNGIKVEKEVLFESFIWCQFPSNDLDANSK